MPSNDSDLSRDTVGASSVGLPRYDLHNHTIYCGHAADDATVANLVKRAAELGLSHVGISEHVMQPSDLPSIDKISHELHMLKPSGVTSLLGIEMDVDPTDPSGDWVTHAIDCDYVILSAHGFPQFDLEIPESDRLLSQETQRKHLTLKWLQWYGNAVRRGGCEILGHPLREPIAMNLIDLSDPDLFERIVQTFAPAADQGIAFELNNAFLSTLSTSDNWAPYLELIVRLRAMKMRFARGSDSHSLLRVGSTDGIELVASAIGLKAADWLDPASFATSV
jgi:histidinol phosphatase-like PHP family hydrolase